MAGRTSASRPRAEGSTLGHRISAASPAPARRDVSPDDMPSDLCRPSALAACRSGSPGRQGFQRPGSARHGVSESDMPRPERGIDPIAGLVAVHRRREYRRAGLASRQPFRSRWLGVRDCPGGRDEASRPRRTQPKVVHLPACSPWLRTDGNAPWGIPESLSPLNVEVAVARRR